MDKKKHTLKVISIINHKGGVGKTITAQNLGAALTELKQNVLLIDFDPQHNLSKHCGVTKENIEKGRTISDLIKGTTDQFQPYQANENGKMYIIPSTEQLAIDNIEFSAEENAEEIPMHLKNIMDRIDLLDTFDYAIIDSAPGSSMLMVNSLYAADLVLLPIADLDSMDGVETVVSMMEGNNLPAKARYIITKYDVRIKTNREIRDVLIYNYGESTMHSTIRVCNALSEAARNNTDVFEYAPKSNGAQDYATLAKEIHGQRKKLFPKK